MSLSRSIGRLGAKVGGNTELIEGVLEGIDPALVAEIVNRNKKFMLEVVSNIDVPGLLSSIDKKVMKEIVDQALDIFSEDVDLLDLDRVAEIINALDYTRTGEMLMKVDPNVLSIALGIMLWSFRNATVAPGVFTADESMETLDFSTAIISERKARGKKR